MKFTYLLINLFIVFFPLIFSFEPKIKYYNKFKQIAVSTIIVCIPFILKDVFFTNLGIWSFNSMFVTGFKIFNLPIEEILFFITVPYSTLFFLEICNYFFREKKLDISKFIYLAIIIFTLLGILNFNKIYTGTICFITSLTLILTIKTKTLMSLNYWRYISFSLLGFLFVNFLLTSLPVVTYNTSFMTNIRITTIPIEDFLYFWNMNTLLAFVYIFQKKK